MDDRTRTALAVAVLGVGTSVGVYYLMRTGRLPALALLTGSDTTAIAGSVPGVTVANGPRLSARQWRFMAALRSVVPSNVPLHVTSGLRSMEGQAKAMWEKLHVHGEPLRKLYGAQVEAALVGAPYETWPTIIAGLYQSGLLDPGGHTGGGAVDLRTSNLTPDQVAALVAGVQSLRAKPLLETAPVHMHVSNLPA